MHYEQSNTGVKDHRGALPNLTGGLGPTSEHTCGSVHTNAHVGKKVKQTSLKQPQRDTIILNQQ